MAIRRKPSLLYVGLFKTVRTTDFARSDTLFYSPGCVVTGLGFLLLAWQG